MGVTLYEVDTVVIGRFNPHIISPPWLAKEKIIDEAESVEVGIAVAGRSVAMQFKTGNLTWRVDFNRLVISTDQTADTGAIAAKVIKKLPHTPLTAIGNNFRYRCSRAQWGGRLPKLGDIGFDELDEQGDVQSVGWKVSIGRPDGVVVGAELSVEPAKESLSPLVSVSLNFHRQASDADAVISAAECFEEDQKSSAELVTSLFHEKVEK